MALRPEGSCAALVMCLAALLCLAKPVPAHGLQLLDSRDRAAMYATANGTYTVLVLQGSWEEMGRQYGALASNRLRRFYTRIVADLAERGIGPQDRRKRARKTFRTYGPELRGLIRGMARTSGLTLRETKVLNAGMILLTQAVLEQEAPDACSAVAAWGKYTPKGKLVLGRNWDIDRKAMRKYMSSLAVVVFRPQNGYAFANIHPLGNVYVETGLNSRGVLVELNNARKSDPSFYPDREDSSSVLVDVLSQAENVEEACRMLVNTPADCSYTIQVADEEKAVAVERPTFDPRVREGRDQGLLVAYNSFVPPYPESWRDRIQPPPSPAQDPRYDNLQALASSETYQGGLDSEAMMDLVSIPVRDGGALNPRTVLQVVAVPADRVIWIRGVGFSGFRRVDLAPLFSGDALP